MDFFLAFTFFILLSAHYVTPSFSLSPLKSPECPGKLVHHPVPFALFFYLRIFQFLPPPPPPSFLALVSLLNYPSARSCRVELGCGRSRDTAPHRTPIRPEAVKNSSACRAWNFDIERKAGVAMPPSCRSHRAEFRREARMTRCS